MSRAPSICWRWRSSTGSSRGLSRPRSADEAVPTDLRFYLFAIPAVILVGLAKGGFTGLGALGTPLIAIGMRDPVRAAAILLPILIVQDIVGVTAFRRTWSGSILAIMLPGAIVGIGLGYVLAATISEAAVTALLGVIYIPLRTHRLRPAHGGC